MSQPVTIYSFLFPLFWIVPRAMQDLSSSTSGGTCAPTPAAEAHTLLDQQGSPFIHFPFLIPPLMNTFVALYKLLHLCVNTY